jgi:hypothetical protein
MLFRKLHDLIAADDSVFDAVERSQFAWFAAFVNSVDGLDWKPPTISDSKKAVEASYQAFLDSVSDFGVFNEMLATLNSLHAPVADVVQMPDEDLTEAEKIDPN